MSVPRLLIGLGIVLVVVGVLWHFGGKYLPLGRLPGDIAIKKEGYSVYFPWVTCLVLSVVISLGLYLFRLFGR